MARADDQSLHMGARGPARQARFTGPGQYLLWMMVFLSVVIAVAALLHRPLQEAFMANPAINGLILGVLLVGILYTFQQASAIGPSAKWLKKLHSAQDPGQLPTPPALIAPMAALIGDVAEGRARISASSGRVVLDSVAARMAESGAFTRYFGRLLIFLGLLGTFYGLLSVVSDVGAAVSAVSQTASGDGDAMQLMAAIEGPIEGMGTAFASSLFGLAGSLVIGFLELQASRAQNRFYNEIEEWLSSISRLSAAGPRQGGGDDEDGGAINGAYLGALLEQNAETVDKLSHTLERHARQMESMLGRVADDAAEGQREAARMLRDEIKVLIRALEAQARINRERRDGEGDR
ncbi:hypothetical protein [Woodsholea maritima]|uniref:hypothetical protein n=1 Tax=Woodsholea maritima TaxID=240237 RepID=UPI0003703491|nr:hypothetical protein [Woodsholea maritima]